MEGPSAGAQRHPVDSAHRCSLARLAVALSVLSDLPSPVSAVGEPGGLRAADACAGGRARLARAPALGAVFRRRCLHPGEKGGLCVGKTKRGKGTKLMVLGDGQGLPIAAEIYSASPHEVTLVEDLVQSRCTAHKPQRLVGDKAYDSDALDQRLAAQGIRLIAPHRKGRKHPTQDGRELRRYRHRWKAERLFAWLFNFRRLVVRYERHAQNFRAFLHLGCIVLLLRAFMR